ncbi:hypothetical protein H5410_032283, partial [Solanum commersonii]
RNIIREDETKCDSEKTYDDPTVYSECDKGGLVYYSYGIGFNSAVVFDHLNLVFISFAEFNDSVSPDINVQKDRLNEEKHEIMSVGNAFGGSGEADETMEMNSHIRDTASQHSEDTPQVNKCMDLTQEVPNRSENAGKKRDHKRTELSKHAFYESHIDNAAQSTIIKEDYAMKYQHPVEQTISAEEVFEMVAEKEISPTKFTSLINNHEQMKAGIVARGGGRVVKSCSTELTDKCILQLGT